MADIAEQLKATAGAVEQAMQALLPDRTGSEARLYDAMRYGTFNGGKRIRAFLSVAAADMFNVPRAFSLRAAAAIEFMHAFSLVHDDLPCMDDAPLRRGKPTAHLHFDEATALLAGDALQSLAFEILADKQTHLEPAVRCRLVFELAQAIGAGGMAGGQMLDLLAEQQDLAEHDIVRLQNLKTGALIRFSCMAGAILSGATQAQQTALADYANALGLAYQIIDDVLDASADQATLGKPARADQSRGKATFVSLWGLDRARAKAAHLSEDAIRHLQIFGDEAQPLRQIVDFLITRHY